MEHIQGSFRMDEKKIFAQNFMMIDIYSVKSMLYYCLNIKMTSRSL